MSTSGDVQYIGGIPWVHRGDIMSTSGGYHEYIGGCSAHWGMFSTSEFSIEIERLYQVAPPHVSWYPPDVFMVSLRCIEHPPMYSWYPPTFIMISPRCTHDIPPMYWTPPDVLNVPRCTERPPMYRTHIIQGDYISHVFHATVANLYSVFVENFTKFVLFRKMLLDKL